MGSMKENDGPEAAGNNSTNSLNDSLHGLPRLPNVNGELRGELLQQKFESKNLYKGMEERHKLNDRLDGLSRVLEENANLKDELLRYKSDLTDLHNAAAEREKKIEMLSKSLQEHVTTEEGWRARYETCRENLLQSSNDNDGLGKEFVEQAAGSQELAEKCDGLQQQQLTELQASHTCEPGLNRKEEFLLRFAVSSCRDAISSFCDCYNA